MLYVGVDIGSTATKVAVMGRPDETGELELARTMLMPTGYSSVDAASRARAALDEAFDGAELACVATGYGRANVPWADKVVTEITCHGRGAAWLFGPTGVVIDVGGQDTKVLHLAGGAVRKFVMNDKCSAGTGRFLEIMADRLGVSQEELSQLARGGSPTVISNMCTVFAESEVISMVGRGEPRANIANGVVESVVKRVATLAAQVTPAPGDEFYLTGGLCENAYFIERLGAALGRAVRSEPRARFAGAIGAAISASRL